MQGAWSEALKRFVQAVHAADGEPITHAGASSRICGSTSPTTTLIETHRTPEFLEAQRRLTRSSTECRLAEREIAEAYCEMHHIPTRTEVDELQRTVYELRRDLRALHARRRRAAHEAQARARASAPRSAREEVAMPLRLQLDPAQTRPANSPSSRGRLVRGGELLRSVKDQDVEIATTPKQEVFRAGQDRALPLRGGRAAQTVKTPVLVVYGLVGRYTMADLQEDRSLIRNLLAQGVDLYAVDWGNPTRTDRWLTSRTTSTATSRDCVDLHLPRARHRPGQPARHLRRRRLHHLLRGAASRSASRT